VNKKTHRVNGGCSGNNARQDEELENGGESIEIEKEHDFLAAYS
jgi:hypothetical protein